MITLDVYLFEVNLNKMRNQPPYIVLILSCFIALVACKHDIINNANPVSTDTTVIVAPPIGGGSGTTAPAASDTVCFNTDVLPLYSSYCGSAGCHDANSRKEGVILTSYTYIMNGIKATKPSSSRYYTIIGGSMPPRNSPQMTANNLATIKKWIEQGALNTQCTNVCDTTIYTYSGAIQSIIANNCGGCHGSKPGSANVYLGDYASTVANISANTTVFLNAINWTSTTAAMNMPQSGKMVACKVTQIQKWIQKGYPQ